MPPRTWQPSDVPQAADFNRLERTAVVAQDAADAALTAASGAAITASNAAVSAQASAVTALTTPRPFLPVSGAVVLDVTAHALVTLLCTTQGIPTLGDPDLAPEGLPYGFFNGTGSVGGVAFGGMTFDPSGLGHTGIDVGQMAWVIAVRTGTGTLNSGAKGWLLVGATVP